MKSNDAAETAATVPHVQTEKFYEAIIDRRIADAEKELDSIRTAIPGTEASKGYLKALEGLLLTAKSPDDKYLYLSKIEKTSKRLKALRKEFEAHSTSRLHSEYDSGYFQALEGFVRKLERAGVADEKSDHEEKNKH